MVGATSGEHACGDGRLARVRLLGRNDAGRAAVEGFVAGRYRSAFGAELQSFMPRLVAFDDAHGEIRAAAGLRAADSGPLFVEQYLQLPIETEIARRARAPVTRTGIVEVGNFAASRAGDTRAALRALVDVLHALGFRWVAFVATRPLRNAFARLGLRPQAIGPAEPGRLHGDPARWGRYYDGDPQVLIGDIAQGRAHLAMHRAGPARPCDARGPVDCAAST